MSFGKSILYIQTAKANTPKTNVDISMTRLNVFLFFVFVCLFVCLFFVCFLFVWFCLFVCLFFFVFGNDRTKDGLLYLTLLYGCKF